MGTLIQIADLHHLREKANQEHKTIALANGCFDLLHVGHINYLKEAKALADILVVALNSDASVRNLKGDKKLIFPEMERAQLLCALIYVDYVIIFDELNVMNVLQTLKPEFHCKGTDYSAESVPEKVISDKLNIHTRIVGGPKLHSSTELKKKIKIKT